jgi:hypothetical protein
MPRPPPASHRPPPASHRPPHSTSLLVQASPSLLPPHPARPPRRLGLLRLLSRCLDLCRSLRLLPHLLMYDPYYSSCLAYATSNASLMARSAMDVVQEMRTHHLTQLDLGVVATDHGCLLWFAHPLWHRRPSYKPLPVQETKGHASGNDRMHAWESSSRAESQRGILAARRVGINIVASMTVVKKKCSKTLSLTSTKTNKGSVATFLSTGRPK